MNPDGSGQVNLSSNAAAHRTGAWSPDSAWIAFKTDRDAGVVRIFVAEADGSSALTTTGAPGLETPPHWVP